MNHNDVIIYIKSQFKNMLDDMIKSLEQPITNNLKKQYKLKNPILHEYCIINSIEEFNRLLTAENKEYMNEISEIDEYILTVDNKYFNESIHISNDIKIINTYQNRKKYINKTYIDDNDDDKDSLTIDTSDKIKIISIEKNNYRGYILYETSDMH